MNKIPSYMLRKKYNFTVKGKSNTKWLSDNILALDKASAIQQYLKKYPEYSNQIKCECSP